MYKETILRQGKGGLSLPNYLYYYWAAIIYKLMFWVWVLDDESPVRSLMVQHSSRPVSLSYLSCTPLPLRKQTTLPLLDKQPNYSGFSKNIDPVKILTRFRIHFKHKQALITFPILTNVDFASSLTDPSFQLWHSRGIKCVKDLFKGGYSISSK